MPRIRLISSTTGSLPVVEPGGIRRLLPRTQLLCWVRLPNLLTPRDGIIDTGSPFSWFPQNVWEKFRPGIDFEELPFEAGYTPPRVRTAGWTFTFRMARLLQPIVLHDTTTELPRDGVVVQFADGNPPSSTPNRPARVVLGLWGGVLEGTNLRMATDPRSGHTLGELEW